MIFSIYLLSRLVNATVAQLVEQRIRNAQVVRSSRTSSSKTGNFVSGFYFCHESLLYAENRRYGIINLNEKFIHEKLRKRPGKNPRLFFMKIMQLHFFRRCSFRMKF
jgi:hypothetical protein